MAFRTEQEVDSLHATIECEQPQPDLYKWVWHTLTDEHILSATILEADFPFKASLNLIFLWLFCRFVGRINIYKDKEEPVARWGCFFYGVMFFLDIFYWQSQLCFSINQMSVMVFLK